MQAAVPRLGPYGRYVRLMDVLQQPATGHGLVMGPDGPERDPGLDGRWVDWCPLPDCDHPECLDALELARLRLEDEKPDGWDGP